MDLSRSAEAAADFEFAQEYDGTTPERVRDLTGVPRLELYARIRSTFDAAHRLAAQDAPAGTLVLADTQTAGRGRNGRPWSSPAGQGIWLTLLERPADRTGLDVLSLRVGLAAAEVLDQFAEAPIKLKWPNDLYVDGKKLAGTLTEARWRDDRPEWVAIGFGVNVHPPADQPRAVGLSSGVRRIDVLQHLVPALRRAASASGPLTADELAVYQTRDLARGQRCSEPIEGRVQGITPSGELLVEVADSFIRVRSGSLVLV